MENFYCLQTGVFGVNSYILPLDGDSYSGQALVVDPAACKLSGDASKITGFLAEKKLSCKAILLTHAHFDHVMGISEIKAVFPEAKVYIHEAEASELGCGERNKAAGPMNTSILDFFEMTPVLDGVVNQPAADVLLRGGEILFDDWKVLYTPGHSQGSVCYYNEKKGLLISGDTMFYHSWGRTDMYGGNEREIYKSLSEIRKIVKAGTKVLPGHDHFGFNIEEN